MRDVVYLLSASGLANGGEEFRYSLRSLQNLPHRRVVVIGAAPDWVDVEVVRFPNIDGDKWANLAAKVALIRHLDLSDIVYVLGDDHFVTEPKGDLQPMYTGTLRRRIAALEATRRPTSVYLARFRETLELLTEAGVQEPLNFNLHAPLVLARHQLRGPLDRPVHAATLAGNLQDLDPVELAYDWKVTSPAELSTWQRSNFGFLSSQDSTFVTSGVRDYLSARFPHPSTYEVT